MSGPVGHRSFPSASLLAHRRSRLGEATAPAAGGFPRWTGGRKICAALLPPHLPRAKAPSGQAYISTFSPSSLSLFTRSHAEGLFPFFLLLTRRKHPMPTPATLKQSLFVRD